jgi:hypothetical protein
MEIVGRRRRPPPVLDYATPAPRRTFRGWVQDCDGLWWLLLLVVGVAIVVARLVYLERRSVIGTVVTVIGLACVITAIRWRRWARSDPW